MLITFGHLLETLLVFTLLGFSVGVYIGFTLWHKKDWFMSLMKRIKPSYLDEFKTPPHIMKIIKYILGYNIIIDLACTKENCVAPLGYTNIDVLNKKIEREAIRKRFLSDKSPSLKKVIYCNPPYSKIDLFVDFVYDLNLPVIMLLPAHTHTSWFSRYFDASNPKAPEISFVHGKILFGRNNFYKAFMLAFFNC